MTHTHQINNGTIELIAYNAYDELGKLMTKRVGGNDVSTHLGLQKVDYRYNIRGWLTGINDISNLSQQNDPTDLFAFKINYDTVENDVNGLVAPLYNGNISETFWRTASDNVKRKYGYRYDALSRMRQAIYQRPDASIPVPNSYNEGVNYDKNGNITGLNRTGNMDDSVQANTIDELNYAYRTDKPNQLRHIID